MAGVGEGANVGVRAVVAGRGDHAGARFGVRVEHLHEIGWQRVERELELLVVIGVHIDGPGAREDQSRERRLVAVAGHDQRLARARDTQHRDVHAHR